MVAYAWLGGAEGRTKVARAGRRFGVGVGLDGSAKEAAGVVFLVADRYLALLGALLLCGSF